MTVRVLLLLALLPASEVGAESAGCGVVVEAVEPEGAAARAGILPGDELLSWSRRPNPPTNPEVTAGTLCVPVDVVHVEVEQAPRGAVTLLIRHDGKELPVELPPGEWQLAVRPRLDAAEVGPYQEAVTADDPEQGLALLRRLVASADERGAVTTAVWYATRAARLAAEAERWPEASTLYTETLERAERLADSEHLRHRLLLELAEAEIRQGRFEEAGSNLAESLRLGRGLFGESFSVTVALFELAVVTQRQRNLERAEELLRQVLETRQRLAPDCLDLAQPCVTLAFILARQGGFDESEELLQRALEIRRHWLGDSLPVASSLRNLGRLAQLQGDVDGAEQRYRQALAMRQRLAPHSREVANSLNDMHLVALDRGNLDEAQEWLRQCLEMREKLEPESTHMAMTLNNLGTVANERGDLASAQEWYRRALELLQKLSPHRIELAVLNINLGSVAHERGDLASAEQYFRRGRDLLNTVAPDSPYLPVTLSNLGKVAERRGDLSAAEDHYRDALRLYRQHVPDSLDEAYCLDSLGSVAAKAGRLDEAEESYRRALAIREGVAPDRPDVATTLEHLGAVARRRGELQEAARLLERSLEIRREVIPGSLLESASLRELGLLALEQDDTAAAEILMKSALAVRERLAPGSFHVAESLHDLAVVCRRADEAKRSLALVARSVDVLEAQRGRLGGSLSSRAAFRAQYLGYYHDYLQLLLAAGQPAEAFAVLERSRARGLLAMLAERDLVFTVDLPGELEQERRLLAATYDRLQAELTGLSPERDTDQVDDLQRRLRELRRRQEEIGEEVRRRNPELATLHDPLVLDLDGVRSSLDPGTVLLSYSVTEDRVYLFVISTAGPTEAQEQFAAFELDTDRARLQAEVRFFRGSISSQRTTGTGAGSARQRAGRLYELLVQPAEPWLASAKRILICPDGVLHTLPFAALVRRGDTISGEDRVARNHYLVEWKPLYMAVSATVAAQLRQRRRPAHSGEEYTVVAFGDPASPPAGVEAAGLAGVERLVPLPATRREVGVVAEVWGDRAITYLGAEANEQRVRDLGSKAEVIHFACHGIVDEQSPLDSALVLTIPEDPMPGLDNGFLQAWEILEEVRLEADLVVLSACDTALGSYLDGEGLIGLTRAFQYAGARAIVATLWAVPDDSTAILMGRFHAGLRCGLSIDQALRQAQMDLLAGPIEVTDGKGETHQIDASAPYAWAGFTVIGDWR